MHYLNSCSAEPRSGTNFFKQLRTVSEQWESFFFVIESTMKQIAHKRWTCLCGETTCTGVENLKIFWSFEQKIRKQTLITFFTWLPSIKWNLNLKYLWKQCAVISTRDETWHFIETATTQQLKSFQNYYCGFKIFMRYHLIFHVYAGWICVHKT